MARKEIPQIDEPEVQTQGLGRNDIPPREPVVNADLGDENTEAKN